MIKPYRLAPFFLALWAATLAPSQSAELSSQLPSANSNATTALKLQAAPATIWQDGVGEGFRSTVETFSVAAGVSLGIATFGSRQSHDMALTSLSYGHMLAPV